VSGAQRPPLEHKDQGFGFFILFLLLVLIMILSHLFTGLWAFTSGIMINKSKKSVCFLNESLNCFFPFISIYFYRPCLFALKVDENSVSLVLISGPHMLFQCSTLFVCCEDWEGKVCGFHTFNSAFYNYSDVSEFRTKSSENTRKLIEWSPRIFPCWNPSRAEERGTRE